MFPSRCPSRVRTWTSNKFVATSVLPGATERARWSLFVSCDQSAERREGLNRTHGAICPRQPYDKPNETAWSSSIVAPLDGMIPLNLQSCSFFRLQGLRYDCWHHSGRADQFEEGNHFFDTESFSRLRPAQVLSPADKTHSIIDPTCCATL